MNLLQKRNDYPHGSCLKTESGYFFVNGHTIKPIPNRRVFKSWAFPLVISTSNIMIKDFVKASPLGYRDGTLIRDISDNRVYLISQQKRRLISDPDALLMIGRKMSNSIWVSHKDTLLHKKGEDL